MESLLKYMVSDFREEFSPAIKILGTVLSSANSENTDLFLFHGGLDRINEMFSRQLDQTTLRELIWCCSNITADSDEHIKIFLDHQELLDKMYFLLNHQILDVR
mmetsp:Transcript_2123/g.3748  ORF Transcript_2123/g.3748 Transcript_2123/m.3748 type:complete len:104 (-) Transcript_2123:651-962(-)